MYLPTNPIDRAHGFVQPAHRKLAVWGDAMVDQIGIFGLGSMGLGMANSILKAGHTAHGFDINAPQMAQFNALSGSSGDLDDIAPRLDIAMIVVLNAAQTKSVLLGPQGIIPRMRKGSVIIGCATVSPDFAREMAEEATAYGIHYLDAPISGGSIKAASGELSIMASGRPEAFVAAKSALTATAQKVFELGDQVGAGSAMKAVNQLLAGVHIATMAEAMTFGMTQGVSPQQFMEVIPSCAGSSWMLENRGPHIVSGDYTPHSSINIWPKDLGIVLDIAKSADFSAPITSAALQQFLTAAEAGLGQEDDAAVAKVYAQAAGLNLPKGAES